MIWSIIDIVLSLAVVALFLRTHFLRKMVRELDELVLERERRALRLQRESNQRLRKELLARGVTLPADLLDPPEEIRH